MVLNLLNMEKIFFKSKVANVIEMKKASLEAVYLIGTQTDIWDLSKGKKSGNKPSKQRQMVKYEYIFVKQIT